MRLDTRANGWYLTFHFSKDKFVLFALGELLVELSFDIFED